MSQLRSLVDRMRVQSPPAWGIAPAPEHLRVLRGLDLFVLWSSLGVGLLVLEAGALLVPGLGLGAALAAIALGTLIGNLLLAAVAVMGSQVGAPTMVLLRSVLGRRGSYIPTVLNVVQLLGWTAFELWVIALAASRVSQALWGSGNYGVWLVVATLWCVFLALGGPLVVVRQWLEKFGIWVVYLVSAWMTIYLLRSGQLGHLLTQAGTGTLPFWLAVDLVVAMPISWLPLVADFSRFARRARPAFWGTYLGYALANVWFYALGALFVLTLQVSEPTPDNLAAAIVSMTGGVAAMIVILVDETDNAFADIYSAAVSIQNIFPRLSQRGLVVGIGGLGAILAASLTMGQFFSFLLLIGSVFVPLFGVLAADYFIVRGRRLDAASLYGPDELEGAPGPASGQQTLNVAALVAWILGFAVYHLVTRYLPWLGASIPALLVACVAHLALARLASQSQNGHG
ncbi:MAG: putative hydroxymethylpyrimidine transporter CytX [Thermoflexales bacterium]|nr:putative hydroxymethylpyrimidine transporter CytX [Thermoflexales bacterium]